MTLDFAIATHKAIGIRNVARMVPPPKEGVRYIVSWQNCEGEIPKELTERKDIEIYRLDRSGVSANRNNALAHSKADIVVMADDDLVYSPTAIDDILNCFKNHPEIDFATFSFTGNGKAYPGESVELSPWPKNYSVATFEIACRRKSLEANNISFDERFGPGSGVFEAGEDEVLVMTMLHRGMKGRFFPITICHHEGLTTGFRSEISDEIGFSFGAVIALMYPFSGILRGPLKAWRLNREKRMPLLRGLRTILSGYFCSLFKPRPWRK